MKPIVYIARNREEYKQVIGVLRAMGLKSRDNFSGGVEEMAVRWFDSYKAVGYCPANKYIDAWSEYNHLETERLFTVCPSVGSLVDAIFVSIPKKITEVKVKLNSEHAAIVREKEIEVGCQKFPHSVVAELQKAIETVTKG
jgi:hypothetical protein